MNTACKAILGLMVVGSSSVRATVNPRDLTVSETHLDAPSTESALVRNYNSGRKPSGLFGRGWCTVWETRLVVASDRAEMNLCGMGKVTLFTPRAGRWISGDPAYVMQQTAGGYAVNTASRTVFEFDRRGRLRGVTEGPDRTALKYDGDRLISIGTRADTLALRYAGARVTEVASSAGRRIEYEYVGDRLVKVRDSDAVKFKYEYAEPAGALTKVMFQNPRDRREYEYQGLQVRRVRSGRCEEKVTAGATVAVQRVCAQSPPEVRTFKYVGHSRATQLTAIVTGADGEFATTWTNDRVTQVRAPAGVTRYSYDPSGLIKSVQGPLTSLNVEQRSDGRPTRISWSEGARRTRVEVSWTRGELTQLSQNAHAVALRADQGALRLTSAGYDLVLKGSGEVRGRWRGRPLDQFSLAVDPGALNGEQLDALGEISNVLTLKEQVERL